MEKIKPTENDKAYIFHVILSQSSPVYQEQGIKEKVWRDIAILGDQSLYDFAESIVNSFGFDFDHCFGFFNDLKKRYDSNDRYELFADIEDLKEEHPQSQSVKNNDIQQVFKKKGDKMLFLFDYGDNWEFIVELKETKEPNPRKSYPYVIDRVGRAPKQYPPCEE